MPSGPNEKSGVSAIYYTSTSNANSQGYDKTAQTTCVVLENMDCICQCGSIQMSVKGLSFPFLFPFYIDTGMAGSPRAAQLAGIYLGREEILGRMGRSIFTGQTFQAKSFS